MNTDMNKEIEKALKNNPELDPAFSDPAFADLDNDFDEVPHSSAPNVKSIANRAADWQAKTDAVVEDSLLGVTNVICGVEMQPFTTARGSLLRRIGNEFVKGIRVTDIEDPFLSIGKFLIMMSKSLPEARKLASDDGALEDAAYALLDTIRLGQVQEVVTQINQYVTKEMSNQVHGSIPDADSTKDTSPKN